MDNKQIFNDIYKNQSWGFDSGPGSDPENAKEWINLVNSFIIKNNIKSILDLGCGDWRLGKELNLDSVDYVGVDVSSIIIEKIKHNEKENIKFINHDIESFDFLDVDLILIKDVLQHLKLESVKNIVDKIVAHGKYALICNDFNKDNAYSDKSNYQINSGDYVYLDLTADPFNYNLTPVLDFESFVKIKRVYLFDNSTNNGVL